ncbi:hypothetical protein POM88_008344 [Heracleum sosnowskyi]|uniref:MATH domain-containing protein n=1 Tax=Heracleum sosnowskyi TaxID=360622 RepID=A0AAD8J775_9APIA|nr:hypothetical protein POM88_008344 [Heracleum sosnowskyi]
MPPTDYMLKIENFSLVSKAMEYYLSNYFEASGYKWRLSMYFNGKKKASEGRTGTGGEESYLSVYLVSADPDVLGNGLMIDVHFKFFVYDQIQKNYVVFEYAYNQTKKFHKLKCTHGILNLMPMAEFCDASDGQYLMNDSCTFGAELLVTNKMTTKAVCLSNVCMPKDDFCIIRAHTWKFDNFSKRKNKFYYSDSFMAGERKWWAYYHQKVYAMFLIVIHDQLDGSDTNTNFRKVCWGTFSESSTCKVNKTFMDLAELRDPSKGFLLNDVLIIEAVIHHIYIDKDIYKISPWTGLWL